MKCECVAVQCVAYPPVCSLVGSTQQSMNDHRTSFPHHADIAKHMALCRGRPLWYLLCQSDAFQSLVQNVWLDSLFPVVRVPTTTATTAAAAHGEGATVTAVAPNSNGVGTLCVAGSPCAPSSLDGSTTNHHRDRSSSAATTYPHHGAVASRPSSPLVHRIAATNYAQDPRDLSTQRESAQHAPHLLVAPMASSSLGAAVLSSASSSSPHDIPTAALSKMTARREGLLKGFRALVESHAKQQTARTPLIFGGTASSSSLGVPSRTAATGAAAPLPARVGATQSFVQDPNYTGTQGGGEALTLRPRGGNRSSGDVVGMVAGLSMGVGGVPSYSQPRIPSSRLLRTEIGLARQDQQWQREALASSPTPPAASPVTAKLSSPAENHEGGTGEEGALFSPPPASPRDWMLEAPVVARYKLWMSTSRARSQADRLTELFAALAASMMHQGSFETMQRLLEPVVQHPVERYRHAVEREEVKHLVRQGAKATAANEVDDDTAVGGGEGAVTDGPATVEAVVVPTETTETGIAAAPADAAARTDEVTAVPPTATAHGDAVGDDGVDANDDIASDDVGGWCRRTRDTFYTSSQLALLELSVFGYLPPHRATGGGGMSQLREQQHHNMGNLRSNPSDLLRARLDMRKRAPLDPTTHIELMLRHTDVKQALGLWWHWLPKHNSSSLTQGNADDPSATMRGATPSHGDVISRNTFVHVAVHMHCALTGGSLPFASSSTLESLRRLLHDDWPYLFMSYQHQQRTAHDDFSVPRAAGGGAAANPGPHAVGISSQFRSLLAKGVECPLSFGRPLFEVSMLLMLEPWMETTAPEERLLALAMLFQRTFIKGRKDGSSHHMSGHMDVAAVTSDTDDDTDRRATTATTTSPSTSSSLVYRLRPFPVHQHPPQPLRTDERDQQHLQQHSYNHSSPSRPITAAVSPQRGPRPSSSPAHGLSSTALTTKTAPIRELVEQLDAAADRHLAAKQAHRNKMEASDVSVELSRDSWRGEIMRLNLRKARSRGTTFTPLPRDAHSRAGGDHRDGSSADADSSFSELELKKTFAPHDASRSYALERVLLQRLTKRVADCSAAAVVLHQQHAYDENAALQQHRLQGNADSSSRDVISMLRNPPAPHTTTRDHHLLPSGVAGGPLDDDDTLREAVRAAEQANIVVHATKHLIPPEYLHQIARYHRSAVEAFRQQVKSATVSLRGAGLEGDIRPHTGGGIDTVASGGVGSDAALMLDMQSLATMLAPPQRRSFETPLVSSVMSPADALEEKIAKSSACFVRRPASAQGGYPTRSHANEAHDTSDHEARILSGVSESLRRPLSALLGRTAPHGFRGGNPRRLATTYHSNNKNSSNNISRPTSSGDTAPATLYLSPYMKVGALPITGGSAFASKKQVNGVHKLSRPSSAQ